MKVAVIGAGTMGSGIAQVCAMAGHEVGVVDSDPSKGDAALGSMRASLEKLAAKDRLAVIPADRPGCGRERG